MANCSYKEKIVFSGEEWECPCKALPGEEFCYWHKEEDGKAPTQEMLEELKAKAIFGVYLKRANLSEANLQEAHLREANLQEATLDSANLQKVDLREANLQKSHLFLANLQEAFLGWANLQEAFLGWANLQKSKLESANLQKSKLREANLQEADLREANLQKAHLREANLQKANLRWANLQKANLKDALLQGTNLHGVRFDSETALEDARLFDANLFRSYFDEAKSFRHAELFRTETDKEINELIGDALGKKTLSVLDLDKVKEANPKVAAAILDKEGLAKFYARDGIRIVFFGRSSGGLRKNLENRWSRKADLAKIERLSDLIVKDGAIQSEYLYGGSRADQFEASYEVYNNLYNFYIAKGSRDQAAAVHYRRGEAYRKLLKEKGGLSWLRSWFFDFLVLGLMAGYGDRIKRPIGASAAIIALFAGLFWRTDGIVKTVNGTTVSPGWLDYFYHSITTFTSLGYSNIQPNLAVGSLPQILVAAESVLGILLMALIIFVVTYQVSR